MTGARADRLVGVDVARCLALLGMVATHVLAERDADGSLTTAQWLAGGRASALFAVLAGVSMALMSGRRTPARGRERTRIGLGLAVRAALIALLGLALGGLDHGIAVILTYYGLLFLLGLPFLGLRTRPLLLLAGGWAVLGPVVSQLVRPHLPERRFGSPSFEQLSDPGRMLGELLFTGYYPVVPWLAYVLLGLALGRAHLRSRRVQVWLAGAGLATAVAATTVSRWLTTADPVSARLLADRPSRGIEDLLDQISEGMYGQTPADGSWAWLLVVAPHSTTPFDLLQTMGSAAFVLGCCLGLAGLAGRFGERALAVFFGAGAMTLTLYTLHVLMRTDRFWPAEEPDSFRWHVLVLLAVGAVFVAARRRGPLEWVVARVSGFARR
ncbi:heparan-alpha-glucosaminide N-acetyltransferase domain-containing protein [Nocardioides dilutus]